MKVIPIYGEIDSLIRSAIVGDRVSQKRIYESYAPKLLSICRRYISDLYEAEDVLMLSFIKIFKSLQSYEGKGSFEAWISKITVFESISYLRSHKKHDIVSKIDDVEYQLGSDEIDTDFNEEELQWMIDQLPAGCKMIFVMYVIDGYKHQDIAKTLNISESTSKSQLAYARKILASMYTQKKYMIHGK